MAGIHEYEGKPITATREEGIAIAVVRLAVKDLSAGSPELRSDAAEFFSSPWYSDILDFLGLPPDSLPPEMPVAIGGDRNGTIDTKED